MLEFLLMIVIVAPFICIYGYFYKKTNKYKEEQKEELHDKEIREKEEKESQELENFINLYQEKEKNHINK